MPSYIEIDKSGSFPAASNVGKIVFGIDTNGDIALTDDTGTTRPVTGGGGGTGLYIPKPIVYASGTVGSIESHGYNNNISSVGDGSGLPGAITNSWNADRLRLTYDTTDETFFNYNPKYFLFVSQGNKKQSKATPKYPNIRLNGKYGRYFAHPPSFSGGVNISTYSNFSGSITDFNNYDSSFASFISEWVVTQGKGKPTILNGFNPLRFYFSNVNGSQNKGQEFFPIKVDDCIGGGGNIVSVTTHKNFSKYRPQQTTPVQTYTNPRMNLYLKFAIVIDDPNNVGRYLIGPMSDTIKIFPKQGYFKENIITDNTLKYYYTWSWESE